MADKMANGAGDDPDVGTSKNQSDTLYQEKFLSQFAGRQKLKECFNFQNFLQNREGEFEIDADGLDANDILSEVEPKNVFENCNFKNIVVEGVPDDETDELMSGDFDKIASSMNNVTPDGGIKKKIDKAGLEGKIPPPGSKVSIHYTALVEVWDEPVDKTDRNGKPRMFKLGGGEVLPALDIGVATMELKERAKILATPPYAYGALGLIDRVPPNATVLFIIELVEFTEVGPVSSIFDLTQEERSGLDFGSIQKAANGFKQEGNRHFQEKHWESAIRKYRKGVKLLDRYVTVEKAVDKARNDLLFILYINLSQSYLNNDEFDKALDSCKSALDLPPHTEGNRSKAYYRRAKAYSQLGRFEEAKLSAKKALDLKPGDLDIQAFYEQLILRLRKDDTVEKDLLKKMASGMKME